MDGVNMPSIMPISNLTNCTEVLKEADELDRIRTARALAADLRRAEERANREGWIDADNFDREMGFI